MTDVWFVRSNGNTGHNAPDSPDFVPGEPPLFPEVAFDYREKCLAEGFARIGWPNTGDLRNPGIGRLAPDGYSFETIDTSKQEYLTQFVSIRVGDLILIPSGEGEHSVHLGVVVRRPFRDSPQLTLRPGLPAYYCARAVYPTVRRG